ncbi:MULTISPECIES: MarR family transcriptional regulator [unclassified Streptomyces]|uniref:MarR family winged helix-turn-helix transcriptional regulator n=1 Tax=unclassified Streptomyces TaxID=2593676 RepID=UPI002E1172F3|nr:MULTISPECIES: MarR family transcriptional regulator [unclassified Streptomyces]WSR27456.1 MarR family transcriptional regulator [Streptomyces sp. NBC_01205]
MLPLSTPRLTSLTPYLLSTVGKEARTLVGDRLAAHGLRLWDMAVLAALDDHGPQPQRDLAERLDVHPSDVVKVLDGLARLGYVGRERDTADRRRVLASISEPGRLLLDELAAETEAVGDRLLAPLDAAERATLQALLQRVHAHARADAGE